MVEMLGQDKHMPKTWKGDTVSNLSARAQVARELPNGILQRHWKDVTVCGAS